MKDGYVPDCFGHVAQLPQILRGFGIDTAFLTRGADLATEGAGHSEFLWQAALLNNLPSLTFNFNPDIAPGGE